MTSNFYNYIGLGSKRNWRLMLAFLIALIIPEIILSSIISKFLYESIWHVLVQYTLYTFGLYFFKNITGLSSWKIIIIMISVAHVGLQYFFEHTLVVDFAISLVGPIIFYFFFWLFFYINIGSAYFNFFLGYFVQINLVTYLSQYLRSIFQIEQLDYSTTYFSASILLVSAFFTSLVLSISFILILFIIHKIFKIKLKN